MNENPKSEQSMIIFISANEQVTKSQKNMKKESQKRHIHKNLQITTKK